MIEKVVNLYFGECGKEVCVIFDVIYRNFDRDFVILFMWI